MAHLKDRSHYDELYDAHTIEQEHRLIQSSMTVTGNQARPTDRQAYKLVTDVYLYFELGERYLAKDATIDSWMKRDRRFDEIEALPAYRPVYCRDCNAEMEPSSKAEELNYDNPEQSRMAYIYFCPNKHLPGRILYTDGTERTVAPSRCERCNSLHVEDSLDSEHHVLSITCHDCNHVERLELSSADAEEATIDPNFARDRARFCLDKEAGEEYRTSKRGLLAFRVLSEQQDERERRRAEYDAVANVKRLSVFAKMAGVHVNYYARIERGEENPSFEKLQSLMKALGLKSLDIL